MIRRLSVFFLCISAAFLLLRTPSGTAAAQRPDLSECRKTIFRVHEAVTAAGVGNAAFLPVPGAPFLRVDRFLAAMGPRADTPEAAAAWTGRMRALDRAARPAEIASLPPSDLRQLAGALGVPPSAEDVVSRYEACAESLLAREGADPGFAAQVRRQASVPDEYVLAYRIAGLYPLAAMPVATLTRRAYRTFLSWHRTPHQLLPTRGVLTTYAPEGPRPDPVFPEKDALGAAAPTPGQAADLIRFFAPVFVVDRAYEFDRPGAVALANGKPKIEEGPAVVYHYLSNGLFRDRPALQLNYVLWFGARGGDEAPVIEHGRLDGITVRVTLDPAGSPVVVEVMNNCGCYHFFLPAEGLVSAVREDPGGIEPLVAATLPAAYPKQPLHLRVKAGWHQVDGVWAAPAPGDARGYRLLPYSRLEALPDADGGVESLFTPKGIAKGSARIEPLLLFPMGIPDVGSMRQRGHHAIKLIGRAHFDDPHLLDRTFVWR